MNLLTEHRLDVPATRRYAERAGNSFVDYFLLNGSTTQGREMSTNLRSAVVELWADIVGVGRIIACCWDRHDLEAAAGQQVMPMAVMDGLGDTAAALAFLRSLPADATVYSHPELFQGLPFSAEVARAAQEAGCLPLGGKLAKIKLPEIAAIHESAGGFRLWDGSARHIEQSLQAGADGIVATPITAVIAGPEDFRPKTPQDLQAVVDPEQATLDSLPDRDSRRRYLYEQVKAQIDA
ncbi:hypothetical protein [Nocardia testacea]|uniref:hypothetical protein n=1 Tax=Nocardia testacea TaxID=248551 RepID=UPI00340A2B9C